MGGPALWTLTFYEEERHKTHLLQPVGAMVVSAEGYRTRKEDSLSLSEEVFMEVMAELEVCCFYEGRDLVMLTFLHPWNLAQYLAQSKCSSSLLCG